MSPMPDNVHDRVTQLKAIAREGADKIHAAGTPLEKRHQATPAEELAWARARADKTGGTK